MGTEIERKFLVKESKWQAHVKRSSRYVQGYLSTHKNCSVRVRISEDSAFLNIKKAELGVVARDEYEYPIPMAEAEQILNTLCEQPLIIKTRYFVPYGQHTWEIDVFSGKNNGLVVAEIELNSISEQFLKPDWLGKEVSNDPRYYNVYLAQNPYENWSTSN